MGRRIAVFGLGYVGLVTGAALAALGHEVVGVDVDGRKIMRLSRGDMPFFEKGLEDLVRSGVESGRLRFTSDAAEAVRGAEFVFICVGTPALPSGEADLSQVLAVAESVGRHMTQPLIVVNKSTVPVGTGDRVEAWVLAAQPSPIPFDVVSNPEFLREGSAVQDALYPARIVIGADRPEAIDAVAELYAGVDAPILRYNRRTAEMSKYASNAFLATKISFINEIAAICDRVGADVTQVAEAMGYDPRIGPLFLRAGVGYGGSCFPKDSSALIQIAGNVYYDFKLLKAVVDVNSQARMRAVRKLETALRGLAGKRIAVLGLSFKPHTDDIRESPAMSIVPALLDRGAHVVAADPAAVERACHQLVPVALAHGSAWPGWGAGLDGGTVGMYSGDLGPPSEVSPLRFTRDPYEALSGADAVMLLTEWPEFVDLDWCRVADLMRGNVVVDGRNAWDPEEVAEAGLSYIGMGRSVRGARDGMNEWPDGAGGW
ncbi:MAG: UDP-glucose/GDP-mannose dehydrogenase family protein [Kyrpidia sp.]|nr:UDP-glucose/GDP-mannose dehydrogenase family protein [Kyrpidia sp.]